MFILKLSGIQNELIYKVYNNAAMNFINYINTYHPDAQTKTKFFDLLSTKQLISLFLTIITDCF